MRTFFAAGWLFLFLQMGYAQEFTAESDSVGLNFGYPVLRAMDDLTFMDENENGRLEANEGGIVSFTLINESIYPAIGVVIRPKELNNIAGIDLPKEVMVGNIPPGGKKLVQIGLAATAQIGRGTASFIFYIRENNEDANISVVYALNTGTNKK
jgi:hypothetical protein